jgi:hypothetical protein
MGAGRPRRERERSAAALAAPGEPTDDDHAVAAQAITIIAADAENDILPEDPAGMIRYLELEHAIDNARTDPARTASRASQRLGEEIERARALLLRAVHPRRATSSGYRCRFLLATSVSPAPIAWPSASPRPYRRVRPGPRGCGGVARTNTTARPTSARPEVRRAVVFPHLEGGRRWPTGSSVRPSCAATSAWPPTTARSSPSAAGPGGRRLDHALEHHLDQLIANPRASQNSFTITTTGPPRALRPGDPSTRS